MAFGLGSYIKEENNKISTFSFGTFPSAFPVLVSCVRPHTHPKQQVCGGRGSRRSVGGDCRARVTYAVWGVVQVGNCCITLSCELGGLVLMQDSPELAP